MSVIVARTWVSFHVAAGHEFLSPSLVGMGVSPVSERYRLYTLVAAVTEGEGEGAGVAPNHIKVAVLPPSFQPDAEPGCLSTLAEVMGCAWAQPGRLRRW